MRLQDRKMRKAIMGTVLSAAVCIAGACPALAQNSSFGQQSNADKQVQQFCNGGGHNTQQDSGKWLSGDFHQHTYYTDGHNTFDFVMEKNDEYGLDCWSNSEHGGSRNRDGNANYWDDTSVYETNPILGDYEESSSHQVMWRWQSLRDFAYPDVVEARATYGKPIFSGLEWNVPDHEHCSISIVSDQMGPLAVSAFEFQFDSSDSDTSRVGEWTPFGVLSKQNETNENAIAACAWMQEQYSNGLIDNAWILFAHIERHGAWSDGGYDIENFRDFNNAAPDICFGFEGAPGHQAANTRGEFTASRATGGGTYGGVGYYSATVGGLWDALLGEGRHWFNFASSDYHQHWSTDGSDFYPGEYQKTYVYALDSDGDGDYSLNEIANGMRSGKSFFVHGDLINALEFTAQGKSTDAADMGSDLQIQSCRGKNPVTITIKFRSPETNNNGDTVAVDHVDLISGTITGKIDPESSDYSNNTNDTTKVLARFSADDWRTDGDGYNVITYRIENLGTDTYFRLRGTNLAVNTAYETDEDGNPLLDNQDELGLQAEDEAYADLWFYSNPIFVYLN